jgi:hypothetical protein
MLQPPGSPFSLDRIAKTVNLKVLRRTGSPHGHRLTSFHLALLQSRLAARKEASPDEFVAALKLREASYGAAGITPKVWMHTFHQITSLTLSAPFQGDMSAIPDGGYYLKEVLANHNRVYARKGE